MTAPRCEAKGCSQPRDGTQQRRWSKYCSYHDRRNQATGDPLGKTISRAALRPYVTMVNDTLDLNPGHAGVQAAIAWTAYRMKVAQSRSHRYRQHARYRADALFARLRDQKVMPYYVVATVTAIYLMREFDPHRFTSDRHFNHQLAKAVYDLAPHLRAGSANSSAGRQLSVGLREYLSAEMRDAFGVLPMMLAKHIAAERKHKRAADADFRPDPNAPPPVRDEAHIPFNTSPSGTQ